MIESWERDAPKLPSDRSIGILFAAVFAALGAVLGWRGAPDAPWMFVVAAVFGLLALLRPSLLAPLNRAWMRLAALLHRIVSPLVLGILYFAVLTPVAMVMRVTGVTHCGAGSTRQRTRTGSRARHRDRPRSRSATSSDARRPTMMQALSRSTT